MNCEQCREHLVGLVEETLDEELRKQIAAHIECCDSCSREAGELRQLRARLQTNGKSLAPASLEAAVMDRILHEQADQIRRLKMRTRNRLIGSGVLAAAAVVLVVVGLWAALPDTRATAAEVLAQAAEATSKLKSVHFDCRMRTLPRDNFSHVDADREFVTVELWKEFGDSRRWRIEKPGRVAVMDGESTVMLIKPNYALKVGPSWGSFDTRWLYQLAAVDEMITRELQSALAKGSDLKLTHETDDDGARTLVVALEKKAGLSDDEYIKNKFLDTSDTWWTYSFDSKTHRLKDLKIHLEQEGGNVLIFEITQIDYDQQFDPSIFALDLPENVIWHKEPEALPDNEKYARMTPEEAAKAFFEACAREDWDEVLKFFPASAVRESIKKHLGGLKIISIGQPFQSGGYGGWFVPYEFKLKSGGIRKHNLALRKDNPAKRYMVDGGL